MFWKRVISAIIFASIVILVIHKGGLWGFFAIVTVAVILSTIEFSGFIISKRSKLRNLITIPINCLLCLSPLKPEFINVNLILFIAIILPFIYEIIRKEPDSALLNVSASVLCMLYIGWLFGYHLILLRQMPDGKELIYLLLGITWSGDIGAYLIGKRFGKHKVMPAISPKKSLEGYIAGLLFGIATSIALCHFLNLNIELYQAVILGIILTIMGQLGDLAESLMKRSAKIKDSGKIMPGHGGILDRCDSMIFITPTLYYYSLYVLKLAGN
jgi:phosphatidate cytidylyltransferase